MYKVVFSIVIPTFNRSSNIIKIIKKLINSPFKIEIIVCDSKSKDQTKEKVLLLKSIYKHQLIKYIDIKQNNHSKKEMKELKVQ